MGSKPQDKPPKKPAAAPAAAPGPIAGQSKRPVGSVASEPGGKLRAQVAYEGDDEFSLMSMAPNRRVKPKVALEALEPGVPDKEEYVPAKDKGVFGLVRKFFGK